MLGFAWEDLPPFSTYLPALSSGWKMIFCAPCTEAFFTVGHIHKNLSNRYKSKVGSAAWMLVLGILCDKKRKISVVPPYVLDPTLPRSGPRMPAKWLDSSSSDVSDKVADFPLVLARGHCAKIIDVRACAANAYLPSRARAPVLSSPGQLTRHCYKIVQSFFQFPILIVSRLRGKQLPDH